MLDTVHHLELYETQHFRNYFCIQVGQRFLLNHATLVPTVSRACCMRRLNLLLHVVWTCVAAARWSTCTFYPHYMQHFEQTFCGPLVRLSFTNNTVKPQIFQHM